MREFYRLVTGDPFVPTAWPQPASPGYTVEYAPTDLAETLEILLGRIGVLEPTSHE